MIDWFSKQNAVVELQEVGEVFEHKQVASSEVYAEIKFTLDELHSIKGQNYQQSRTLISNAALFCTTRTNASSFTNSKPRETSIGTSVATLSFKLTDRTPWAGGRRRMPNTTTILVVDDEESIRKVIM